MTERPTPDPTERAAPGPPDRLDGRVALVTGGTRGIGRAIAETYARAGAAVAVVARKADELAETEAALVALGTPVITVAGSVDDPDVVTTAVARTVGELGRLDVLVNNAATNPAFGPTIEVEARAVRKILAVNLEGPLALAQAAWSAWMRDHGGVILNIASVGGLDPAPFIGTYNVSKAALIHLTRQLALELAPGVRVNAIAPGLVRTEFARALWEPDEAGIDRRHPLGRMGRPDDVAALARFLASDAAAWITGEVYRLDGGLSLV
ncbi:MAG: SDR family oxidoreductase [Actinobacteria bacterium]|nr:SDR family oxidoreductase [Actinomycetota bacterium]